MKIYLVGGAVRDELLHLPIKERDWVVVGATPSDMLQLGYRQVGKDFPVFLHPHTHEEYALARTERKVAPGYQGFVFDAAPTVTLEADLARRDLTINAIAKSGEGDIIDPYHGQQDLKAHLLRHVSPAFSEDPVRILRVGRFLARYATLGFTVAPATLALMQKMVKAGEVDALVAERVWKEFERALSEPSPEKFFEVLIACHAFAVLFPTWQVNSNGMRALNNAAKAHYPTVVRFAVLCHDVPDSITWIANRYRIPRHYRDLAQLTARFYQQALNARTLSADDLLQLLMGLDIFRREERFDYFLKAVNAIAKTENKMLDEAWLVECAALVKAYDVQLLIKQGLTGLALAQALYQARKEIVANFLFNRVSDL